MSQYLYPEDHPGFWDDRYQKQNTPWDLDGPTPVLESLVREFPQGKVCIIGAGNGHDALLFAKHGFGVTALDFAPHPMEKLISKAGELHLPLNGSVADLFKLPPQLRQSFDLVIEHTLYCAINPARRLEYEAAVYSLLRPEGILAGVWFPIGKKLEQGGPPWGIDVQGVHQVFSGRWDLLRDELPDQPHPGRENRERVMVFRKKSMTHTTSIA